MTHTPVTGVRSGTAWKPAAASGRMDRRRRQEPATAPPGRDVGSVRESALVAVAAVAAAIATLLPAARAGPVPGDGAAGSRPPDILLINTDDQRWDSLGNCLPSLGAPDSPGAVACMPNVRTLLAERGVSFANAYATTSHCCPSRASLLTGNYAHTHRVLTSRTPFGGAERFEPHEASNLATWLHDAGYRTGLFGKYMNGYLGPQVPPGWDEWRATYGSSSESYSRYRLVENGVVREYDDYVTTRLGGYAVDFVRATPSDRPMFLYFAPRAPHFPYQPRKDTGDHRRFDSMAPWRPPSFQEADVTDKPAWVAAEPVRTPAQVELLDAKIRSQLETLIDVDRQVASILAALGPRLSSTLVVFTSDNAMSWGEHRYFNDKNCAYEECHHVPLVIRFDPLTAAGGGAVEQHPVLNIDLAPTIAELAGLSAGEAMDGRSLVPLLAGTPPADWRTAVLGEDFGSLMKDDSAPPPTLRFIRTFPGDPSGGAYKYVELCAKSDRTDPCATAERELYDEVADPYELCNLLQGCGPAPPGGLVQDLAARLLQLQGTMPPVVRFDPEPPEATTDPLAVSFVAPGASRFRCAVDGAPPQPCASPMAPPGQAYGAHSLTVLADGPDGTSSPASVAWTVEPVVPAAPRFLATPGPQGGPDAEFRFEAPDAVALECSLDGEPYAACVSPHALAGLAPGTHGFRVRAVDGSGNVSNPARHRWSVVADVLPPALTMKTPRADDLLASRRLEATWSATDEQGLDRVEVFRRTGLGGTPVRVQTGTEPRYVRNGTAAGTYCFVVVAYDRAGNSTTGPERCAAVPLDDGALAFAGPVIRVASPAALDGTVTELGGAGARTEFTFTGRKVGVLFWVGPDAGTADLFLDGTLARHQDLYANNHRSLWWTKAFGTVGSHTVRIEWVPDRNAFSSGVAVRIDGVAAVANGPPAPGGP